MYCRRLNRGIAVIAIAVLVAGCGNEEKPAGDVFTVDDQGISLVGSGLSRNDILAQLVAHDGAVRHGGPLIDRTLDIHMENATMGEALGVLLAGASYQARFEHREGGRARLQTLWLGDGAMDAATAAMPEVPGIALASPLQTADGSVDGGEPFVRMLLGQYNEGDPEARKMAIMDVELTTGGVAFLDHVLKTAQDEDLLIEAIRRLEIGEEFGARWALLEALGHDNPVILLEVLASLEVWRDPTIRRYIVPLTEHGNADVREKAAELIEDLDTYAEVDLAGYAIEDDQGVDESAEPVESPITGEPEAARPATQ